MISLQLLKSSNGCNWSAARRYYHCVGEKQWEYAAWLAQQADGPSEGLPEWRKALYTAAEEDRKNCAEAYRDKPVDAHALQQAEQAAEAYLQQQPGRRQIAGAG